MGITASATTGLIQRALICLVLLCSLSGTVFPKHAEQFLLKSADGKLTYVVDVWTPLSYQTDRRHYPMLLMLDGEYGFKAAVEISAQLQRNNEVTDFLIVGLSYGVGFGKPLAAERSRDFTPPVDPQDVICKSDTLYYRFIKDRLLPELHTRYRIDSTQRALWGYSLSGSFAAWINYHDSNLFGHTILASGNLLGYGIMQRLTQGQIFSNPEQRNRRVFISFDLSEVPDPKIVEDGKKLLSNKSSFPGYDIRMFVTTGESHASSWFASLPAGLRFIFPPKNSTGFGEGPPPMVASPTESEMTAGRN